MPPVRTQVRISPKHPLFFVQGDLMETEEIRVKMCTMFLSVMLIHVFVKFWLSANNCYYKYKINSRSVVSCI